MSVTNIFDRLFPAKYDFFEMLLSQATYNARAADWLFLWLQNGSEEERDRQLENVQKADDVRKELEQNLVDTFSTPFDRGEIYLLSVSMHKVAEYAKSTILSMEAFDETSNEVMCAMAENLKNSCDIFADAMKLLRTAPLKAELLIPDLRRSHISIEQLYRDGMADVFKCGDAMFALKKREVYHHIKDASSNLEDCVDILHRIIVRLT